MGTACPSCQAQSEDGALYCARCGARLSLACTGCGAPLAASARFCSSCGAATEGEAPAAEREERKIVSALFADVVGSTVLGERLELEDFTTVVGEAVAHMAGAVTELGGTVSELAGDGLLALFGAPVAHEDDAERAVRAGLEIVGRIDAYQQQAVSDWGVEDFSVRVGIETGLAVLAPVGGQRSVGYAAMGDALNTAARLQAAADPGTVLVGPRTHASIESVFAWSEPRELTLKGKAQPVVAHAVATDGAPAPSTRRRAGPEAPLVGREREVAFAGEAVDEVLGGRGGILFISGDAGIGKSRMVRELRGRLAGSGADPAPLWLDGRCVSYGDTTPYLPIRALLREWLATVSETAALEEGARLRTALARLFGPDASAAAPFLAALLDVPLSDDERSELDALDPEGIQERTFEAVAALLVRASVERPVAVALDDMHWADASSLALIERLLVLTADSALLLVLAARPERDHPVWTLKELVARDFAHRSRDVTLRPLGADADRDLLRAMLGAETLPEDLQRRLLDRAEGNPFFLEELIRSLIDAGALKLEDGRWRFDSSAPVDLPETVEKVVLARIDRLPAPLRDVLSAAAVLGRQFELSLLEKVLDADGDAGAALRELDRLDLVRQGRLTPVAEYRFKHSLIQETAYHALLKRHRQALHRRAAEAIAALHGDDGEEHDAVLARHHGAAGDHQAALECHRRAASAAARIAAVDEALEHLDGALAAGAELGLGPEDRAIRELLIERGELRYNLGWNMAGAMTDLGLAIEGATAAGDSGLHVEALITLCNATRVSDWPTAIEHVKEAVRVGAASGDPVLRVKALSRLAIAHANVVQLDRASEAGRRALELATAVGDPESRGLALDALKLVAQQLGDIDLLEQLCEQLVELYLASDAPFYLDWAMMESSFVSLARCEWDDALARIEEALALTRNRGHRLSEPLFLDALCWTLRSRGSFTEALATSVDAIARAREAGHDEWSAWTEATRAWALLDLRAARPAAARLELALSDAERARAPAQVIRCASLLSWARLLAGDQEAASALADRAEQLLATVTVPPGQAFLYGAHAYVAVARVRLATGAPERAHVLLAPILAAAERARWYETIGLASLVIGESLAARGDSTAAEAALAKAVEVSHEHELPGLEWEARAALARLLRSDGHEAQAADHAARGIAIVERLAAGLQDELRDQFRRSAMAELTPAG